MKAVLSVTTDPLYSFLLPFATWSWYRIGVGCIVFYPRVKNLGDREEERMGLVWKNCPDGTQSQRIIVDSRDKEATYAQVARLYGCMLPEFEDDEVLVTSDCDMAVFGDYLLQGHFDRINIYGHDLVEEGQYPMCYISMQKKMWRKVMGLDTRPNYQQVLHDFLEPISCEHMRGNYWCLDQETIFNKIKRARVQVHGHSRANVPQKFATRRADRDNWPQIASPEIIDAHLPRPGYVDGNFERIITLFQQMYPQDDFAWMMNYRDEFLKLL